MAGLGSVIANAGRQAAKAARPRSGNVFNSPIGPVGPVGPQGRASQRRAAARTQRAVRRLPAAPRPATPPQIAQPTHGQRVAAHRLRVQAKVRQQVFAKSAKRDAATISASVGRGAIEDARRLRAKLLPHGGAWANVTVTGGHLGDETTPYYFSPEAIRRGLPGVPNGVHTSTKGLTLAGAAQSARFRPGEMPHDIKIRRQPLKESGLAGSLDTGVGAASKAVSAPAVKALNAVAVPYHAIAGAADAGVKGKSITHGFLHPKNGVAFSDVLKDAGVKNKLVRGVAGFALDVATDPTTYLAPEAGLAKGTAEKLAVKGVKNAETKGVRLGARFHVPFTDKAVNPKTSGRLTAKLARGVKRVPGAQKTGGAVRQAVGESVAPDLRPIYRDEAQQQTYRRATRGFRAREATNQRVIVKRGRAYTRALKNPDEHAAVRQAIENGTVKQLPPHLQQVAQSLRLDLRSMAHSEITHGIRDRNFTFKPQGPEDAQGYIPHVHKAYVGDTPRKPGGSAVRVSAEHGREIRQPLDALEAQGNNPFITDLPRIFTVKAQKTGQRINTHQFWQEIANVGHRVEPGQDIHLHGDERVYEVTPHGLTPLEKWDGSADTAAMREVATGHRTGNFVALDRRTYQDALDEVAPQAGGRARRAASAVGRGYDKVQGGLKFATTIPVPAYHARNLFGDSMNSWLADTSIHSFLQSGRAIKALHTRETIRGSAKAVQSGGRDLAGAHAALTRPIKLGTETSTIGRELQNAEEQGAIRTGFAGSELRSLVAGAKSRAGHLRSASEYREDYARFATYLSARKRGLDPAGAAEWSLKHHFDYGDLTPLERGVLRRLVPFYTFFARNTRLQATKFLTRPGKFATQAKILDEASKAVGYQSYNAFLAGHPDYKQRGLAVPISHDKGISISPPTTDLNQLTANPSAQIQNIVNRVTFYKLIPELKYNYSFFFQGPIERPDSPLVPAPSWVQYLPAGAKKSLGVTNDLLDKKSGKKVWGWRAKVDYVARQLPESQLLTQLTTPGQGSRGLNAGQQALGFLTGAKVVNFDKNDQINAVEGQLTKVQAQLGALRQRGITATSPNAQYKKLLDQQRALQSAAYTLKQKQGYKVLPKTGKPSSSSGGGWGQLPQSTSGPSNGWGQQPQRKAPAWGGG